jgi:catalase
MVAHLRNIHADLAQTVAKGLGMDLPQPAEAARQTRKDLAPSPALSIIERGPSRFEGRKLGIFVSDGADAAIFHALVAATDKAAAKIEVVAPKIAGAVLSDGKLVSAKQKIDGGPSVLFDAVAVLLSETAAPMIAKDAPSKDFVSDAFAHCKFIAYNEAAAPLFEAAGISGMLGEGCFRLASPKDVGRFIEACGKLRALAARAQGRPRRPEVSGIG